jgi:hypothetical protein
MTDIRPRLNPNSATYREQLWDACKNEDGRVFCNLCGLEVRAGDAWDESHIGIPAAHGGNVVGVGHFRCNREDGAKNVTPFVAKGKRIRRKHIGADAPGLGRNALPGGNRSAIKKKLNGEVVAREPRYASHRALMARREIGERE